MLGSAESCSLATYVKIGSMLTCQPLSFKINPTLVKLSRVIVAVLHVAEVGLHLLRRLRRRRRDRRGSLLCFGFGDGDCGGRRTGLALARGLRLGGVGNRHRNSCCHRLRRLERTIAAVRRRHGRRAGAGAVADVEFGRLGVDDVDIGAVDGVAVLLLAPCLRDEPRSSRVHLQLEAPRAVDVAGHSHLVLAG